MNNICNTKNIHEVSGIYVELKCPICGMKLKRIDKDDEGLYHYQCWYGHPYASKDRYPHLKIHGNIVYVDNFKGNF